MRFAMKSKYEIRWKLINLFHSKNQGKEDKFSGKVHYADFLDAYTVCGTNEICSVKSRN